MHDSSSDSSDVERALESNILTPIYLHDESENGETSEKTVASLPKLIMQFKQSIISTTSRQLFSVSRSDGVEQLKVDILGAYKNPNTPKSHSKTKTQIPSLTARPRVCFEGEEGVGAGPVREFLISAVKLVEPPPIRNTT